MVTTGGPPAGTQGGAPPGGAAGAAGVPDGGGGDGGRAASGDDSPGGSCARAAVSNASRDRGRAAALPDFKRSLRFTTKTRAGSLVFDDGSEGSNTRTIARDPSGTLSGLSVEAKAPDGSTYVNSQRPPLSTSITAGAP